MSIKSYFTKPTNAAAAAAQTEAQRQESYKNRASNATWLLVGLGAAVAMINGETFSRVTQGISNSLIISVYLEVIVAAIMLGFARLLFQHADRTLANEGYGNPPNKDWPASAEATYTFASLLCLVTLLTLMAVLSASLAHPAPLNNEKTGGGRETPPNCPAICPSSSPTPSDCVGPPPKSDQPRPPSPAGTHDGGSAPGVKGPAPARGQGGC